MRNLYLTMDYVLQLLNNPELTHPRGGQVCGQYAGQELQRVLPALPAQAGDQNIVEEYRSVRL